MFTYVGQLDAVQVVRAGAPIASALPYNWGNVQLDLSDNVRASTVPWTLELQNVGVPALPRFYWGLWQGYPDEFLTLMRAGLAAAESREIKTKSSLIASGHYDCDAMRAMLVVKRIGISAAVRAFRALPLPFAIEFFCDVQGPALRQVLALVKEYPLDAAYNPIFSLHVPDPIKQYRPPPEIDCTYGVKDAPGGVTPAGYDTDRLTTGPGPEEMSSTSPWLIALGCGVGVAIAWAYLGRSK